MRSAKKKTRSILIPLLISLLLLGGIVYGALQLSDGLSGNISTSKFPVYIREYMSSNTLYPNESGVCCDWVELYNSADTTIEIGGFHLTDDSRKSIYTIPSGTMLEAHGSYVIYCMRSGGAGYADMGISRSGGEELLLLNRKNVLIDSVLTIPLAVNTSAERQPDGSFIACDTPSPGADYAEPVTEEEEEPVLTDVPGPVSISEVIPANTFYADENGHVTDIVELVNTSDAPVDIGGYVLQQKIDGKQFTVPAGTVLAPGGYYLIYCARSMTEGLYADFALSRSGGELLLLYTPDNTLTDHLTTVVSGRNEGIVRTDGVVTVLGFATPGFENTEAGLKQCLQAHSTGPVTVSEIMTSNESYPNADETVTDWVELYAAADTDLSGWGLSDTCASARYLFPEGTVLRAGEYLLVPCDGSNGKTLNAAHFGLSSLGGEILYLTRPDGTLADACVTIASSTDASLVRSGADTVVSDTPTPGFENSAAGRAAYEATLPRTVTGLVISEIMPRNACTLPDGNGRFLDWVELYNAGTETLDLSRFCFSDKESDPVRFRLPDRSLAPGEYVIVFCAKDATAAPGETLAPFGLSAKGATLYISTPQGKILDTVSYPQAAKDRSFIRGEGASVTETEYPTPGFANTAAGYNAFIASNIPQGLYIAEVMPSNRTIARTNGSYYDWIELCNGSDSAVTLSDYTLTDDPDMPGKCVLPKVTLESGKRYLVYCSGDASLTDSSAFHCPFTLNGGEDRVYLYRSDGTIADYLHVFHVPVEGSIGRDSREGGIQVYETPTPGKANTGGTEASPLSVMPVSDKASGIYAETEGFFVTLSGEGTIYYTLDGSKPVPGAKKTSEYTEPVQIKKTSVLRAVLIEPDKRPSEVLTLAYTVNEGHNIAVLNLVMDPADFDGKTGIYSHPKETWEREACIVFTDANGTVTHDCGVRISGQHSRTRAQKSFKLIFSDRYGGRLRYDIFGETCEQKTFPALLIRAGIDSKYGIFREPLIQHLALPFRDTMFVQDSVPCILYVNGAYYGIYFFMEALTEESLADRVDVTTDSVTMYKGYLYPEHTYLEIYRILLYIQENDMTRAEHFEYVKAHLHLEDLIDWAIFQAYCHNADVSANIRYFVSDEDDGRWHFVFYDVECGFKAKASFDVVLTSGNTAEFLVPLLQNSEFRDMFLKRLAYHCENTFPREKVLALLYEFDAAVRPETERHFKRWNLQPKTYVYNFNRIESLIKEDDRVEDLKQSAKKLLKLSDSEYARYFGGR